MNKSFPLFTPRYGLSGMVHVFAAALACGCHFSIGQFGNKSDPAAGQSSFQISDHMRGAPIPTGPKQPKEADFQKLYNAWLQRTVVTKFPADKDPKGAKFVKEAATWISLNPWLPPPHELTMEAEQMDMVTQTDAAVPLFAGIIEPASPARVVAFSKALELVTSSHYPKFIWFMAASNLGKAHYDYQADFSTVRADDEAALKYLAEAFEDDSFLQGEGPALRWRIASAPSYESFAQRNALKINEIVDHSTKLEPWIKEFIEGYDFVREAWAKRGDGWAKTVTGSGWNAFADNLALARVQLTKSWQDNPHDPGAATAMITVAMGENEEKDTMRTWFDRAVAADMDYNLAYDKYSWGLRPRWLGSANEMTAFGRECAATNRYDTLVPYERVQVALDIADDNEDNGKSMMVPDTANELLAVLDRYLGQPDPVVTAQYAHTLAAILNHGLGRMDAVNAHLRAINYEPSNNAFLKTMDDLPALVQQAKGANGQ